MIKKILCTTAIVMGLAVSASAVELGVRATYWVPDLEADIQVDSGGVDGTEIDAVDTLGLDDESFPALEVFAGLGSHHLALSAMQMNYEGNETITATIDFGDETYTGGSAVSTDLDITMVDFYYRYDLLDLENIAAGFSIGPMLQIKYLDAEMTLETVGKSERESLKAPIPMVGLGMHIGILADMLEANVKVAGIGYSGNSVVEATAEVNFTPFPLVNVGGGYRYLVVDVDESDVMIDLSLTGPFLAVSVGF
jgi:outer membrane protein